MDSLCRNIFAVISFVSMTLQQPPSHTQTLTRGKYFVVERTWCWRNCVEGREVKKKMNNKDLFLQTLFTHWLVERNTPLPPCTPYSPAHVDTVFFNSQILEVFFNLMFNILLTVLIIFDFLHLLLVFFFSFPLPVVRQGEESQYIWSLLPNPPRPALFVSKCVPWLNRI